jgi:hypothetical protein
MVSRLLNLPNNIIHPTRTKELAFVSSFFGRVMMSVILFCGYHAKEASLKVPCHKEFQMAT